MKKFLLGLFMTLGLMAQASHLSGGDIQYRYIGDSTGIARQYKVILRLYRDITGIGLPTNETVNVYSGCGTSFTVPVTLTPGSGVVSPTLFDCVDPGTSTKTLEVYQYVGYTTLPNNCANFTFWYSNCCRPGGISNIAISSSQGFYFEAFLNNAAQGQNSSPVFVSEPVRAFCVGNTFNWKQTAIEEDGDSVVYSLINCRTGLYATKMDIQYLPGWTTQQPVTSSQFVFNQNTGQITFTPTTAEIDVLSVRVDEYRWDTVNLWWYPIGSASRDMMITVSPTCNPTAMSGVQYDTTLYETDTITGFPLIKASCGDTSFKLKFHIALDCYSINGVDFRMTNMVTNQPWAIDSLWSVCDVNAETDSIMVELFQALQPGRYYLYSKKGNDGNTLINKCGIAMNEFDTIVVEVGPCPPAPPPGEAPNLLEGTGLPLPPAPPVPTPTPIFPNVITPNGDGTNDCFTIKNAEQFTRVNLKIYNRWGYMIYRDIDYNNDFGFINMDGFSDGVYFYVCELYFEPNNETLYYSGNITILSE
jgi:gliding motility-associated-like protein